VYSEYLDSSLYRCNSVGIVPGRQSDANGILCRDEGAGAPDIILRKLKHNSQVTATRTGDLCSDWKVPNEYRRASVPDTKCLLDCVQIPHPDAPKHPESI